MEDIRLFFVTDIHGSTTVLAKAMDESRRRGADLLLVCGDLEGKYLLFIEEGRDRITWEDPVTGARRRSSRDRLATTLDEIANCGGYGVVVPEGWDPAFESEESLERMIQEHSQRRLAEWIETLEGFARRSGLAVLMMPGNDDAWEFDNVILSSEAVVFLDERVWEFRGYRFVGTSRVPPTPWRTPREITEEDMAQRLERIAGLGNAMLPLILVAHTPPYACGLDNAPLLDKNRKQVILGGVMQTTPVGSTSLRRLLEARQDIPLALHGHVHESAGWARVGSTLCLNPGTEYFTGTLVGYDVRLTEDGVKHFERIRI
jgi:Icc-related predicted phosphoesterase